MLLDVFAEERRIGETKTIAYLLDAQVGLFQAVANVLQDVFGNPLVGRLARLLLADDRQVLGRDAQLVGVRLDGAVLVVLSVQQVEETLEMATARAPHVSSLAVGRRYLPHKAAEPQHGGPQQRLDDIRTEWSVRWLTIAFLQKLVEKRKELHFVLFQGDDVKPMDIHHLVPYIHLLMQEVADDSIRKEHRLQVEIRTDHEVGDMGVGRYHAHLVLTELNLLPVHHALHLPAGADGDGAHGHMGRGDLGKLLDTVDDDDIAV